MDQGFIMPGRQGQIPDDGSEAQVVGAQHEADKDNDKPLKSGVMGKAGTKSGQHFIYKFQHGLVDHEGIG